MCVIFLLSFCTGYLLNEEKSLSRLCEKMGYPHAGWLVFRYKEGFFLFLFFLLCSFLKSWIWGLVLKETVCLWYIPAGMYILGNKVAIANTNELGYTPWSALTGMLIVENWVICQNSFTLAVLCFLITKDLKTSFLMWKKALFVSLLVITFCWKWIWLLVVIILVRKLLEKHALFKVKIIE
ncbi:MAG: hypothetical protein PHI90_07680 [Clostridia bacterium]|nr:hypothetical protein [Clostridia bacterium]MDD4048681.1 hypothetical protein [Clostridia bacterium]